MGEQSLLNNRNESGIRGKGACRACVPYSQVSSSISSKCKGFGNWEVVEGNSGSPLLHPTNAGLCLAIPSGWVISIPQASHAGGT